MEIGKETGEEFEVQVPVLPPLKKEEPKRPTVPQRERVKEPVKV